MAFLKVSPEAVSSPGHTLRCVRNEMVHEETLPLVLVVEQGASVAAILISDEEIVQLHAALGTYLYQKVRAGK